MAVTFLHGLRLFGCKQSTIKKEVKNEKGI